MKVFFIKLALALCLVLFSSCDEILMEEDVTEYHVSLVAPVNDAVFSSTSISFNWESVEGASKYHLQVAKPTFESPLQIVLDTVVPATHFTYQVNVGEYEWRVKAMNSSYQSSYTNRFFSIVSNEDFQNNLVVLQSPANNFVTNNLTNVLSWLEVIGATSYEMQVFNSSNTLISTQLVLSTTVSYTFPEGNLSWRVRATNGTQTTLYTSRSILIDNTVPNTPQLVSPSNNSVLDDGQVSLQWIRASTGGSPERDSVYVYSNSSMTALHSKYLGNGGSINANIESGNYFWVVRAFDQAGNAGVQSSTFAFTIN